MLTASVFLFIYIFCSFVTYLRFFWHCRKALLKVYIIITIFFLSTCKAFDELLVDLCNVTWLYLVNCWICYRFRISALSKSRKGITDYPWFWLFLHVRFLCGFVVFDWMLVDCYCFCVDSKGFWWNVNFKLLFYFFSV